MTQRINQRTLQEYVTSLSPAEVLAEAKHFFTRQNTLYATFLDMEGDTYVSFRGQGGEEIVIAVAPAGSGTRVTGSTYLFDMQVARFLATLPPATVTVAPTGGSSTATDAGTAGAPTGAA